MLIKNALVSYALAAISVVGVTGMPALEDRNPFDEKPKTIIPFYRDRDLCSVTNTGDMAVAFRIRWKSGKKDSRVLQIFQRDNLEGNKGHMTDEKQPNRVQAEKDRKLVFIDNKYLKGDKVEKLDVWVSYAPAIHFGLMDKGDNWQEPNVKESQYFAKVKKGILEQLGEIDGLDVKKTTGAGREPAVEGKVTIRELLGTGQGRAAVYKRGDEEPSMQDRPAWCYKDYVGDWEDIRKTVEKQDGDAD